ncbi:hypothetical protein BH09ACT10_BH09ACT10_10320 [soil metagenome]
MMDLRSPRATTIIGTLALLLIIAVSWMFVVGPEMSRLSAVRTQIQETRNQNDVLRVQVARLAKQSQDLAEVRQAAGALADKFPPTADQPGLFGEVTAAAVDAGIGADGITTLAPNPPVIGDAANGVAAEQPTGGGQLARQAVSISIEGTYAQTLKVLSSLEQMKRAYLISSVSLSGGAEAGYTTTVAGDMFVMAPVTDPGDDTPEPAPSDSAAAS